MQPSKVLLILAPDSNRTEDDVFLHTTILVAVIEGPLPLSMTSPEAPECHLRLRLLTLASVCQCIDAEPDILRLPDLRKPFCLQDFLHAVVRGKPIIVTVLEATKPFVLWRELFKPSIWRGEYKNTSFIQSGLYALQELLRVLES